MVRWAKADASLIRFPGQIYLSRDRGSARFVVTHAFQVKGNEFSRSLENLDDVQEARASFLRLFGITHYQILNRTSLQVTGFERLEALHTQFVAPNGRVRHAIERQYSRAERAYIVTYIEEIPSLSDADLERIGKTLDLFSPDPRRRVAKFAALSNLYFEFVQPADADDNETVSSQPLSAPPPSNSAVGEKLEISTGPLPDYCDEVPKSERRTTDDNFLKMKVKASDFAECPHALKKGAVGLYQMLDKIDRATDSNMGSQIIAGAGAAAVSFYNDPKGMTKRALTGLYNFVKEKTNKGRKFFNCLNAKAVATRLCETIPSLVAGGVAGKLVVRGAAGLNAADEIASGLEKTVSKAGAAEGDAAATATKSATRELADSEPSASAIDSDRVMKAQSVVGRDLTPEQQQAVVDAHEVGAGQAGKDGSAASIGNYNYSQLKEKAKTLKEAGISKSERRALIENGVVGAPFTEAASSVPKALLQGTGDPRVDGFRDAYTSNDFSGNKKYISFYDYKNDVRLPAKIVRKTEDGKIDIDIIEPDGRIEHATLSQNALADVRLSDVSMAQDLRIGQEVMVPRSSGGTSKATVAEKLPDGQVRVSFRESGNTYEKTVPASRLTIEQPAAPSAPSAPSVRLTAKEAIDQYSKEINQLAPPYSPDGRPQYVSNGYWRTWMTTGLKDLPAQGWKMHVGAKPETALQIAKLLAPEFQRRGIPFKVVDDLKRFAARNPQTDSQAGKFITVYPKNGQEAAQISRTISELLKRRGFKPGDFLDAPGEGRAGLGVSYRYDRITGDNLTDPRTGQEIPHSEDMLLTPDGHLVPDQRGIIAPNWVQNPFH